MLSCPFARFSKGCQVLPSPFSKGLTPFAKGLTPFHKGLTPFAKGYPFCQGGDPFYQGFCQEADPFCQGVAPLSGWSLLPRVCTVDSLCQGVGPFCQGHLAMLHLLSRCFHQVAYRCCLSSNASSLVMWSSSTASSGYAPRSPSIWCGSCE